MCHLIDLPVQIDFKLFFWHVFRLEIGHLNLARLTLSAGTDPDCLYVCPRTAARAAAIDLYFEYLTKAIVVVVVNSLWVCVRSYSALVRALMTLGNAFIFKGPECVPRPWPPICFQFSFHYWDERRFKCRASFFAPRFC